MHSSGTDALTGGPIEVTFGAQIDVVETTGGASEAIHLAPGFIDLQVNGFAGVDYNQPTTSLDDIAASIRRLFSTGVTRFYPTVVTASPEHMAGCLRNLAAAKQRLPEGAAIEGFHVEGPHISPEDGPRGAHPLKWVRRPDIHELRRMQDAAGGLIRMVTLSPEWPEAPRYTEAAVAEGIVVSIGHTKADAAQIGEAVGAGATLSTHLGNGAHPILARHPNYIWDQLAEDRLTAAFIADGHHVPAAFLKAAFRAKGPDRRFIVTDVVFPAACEPGLYPVGEKECELLPDQRLVLAGKNAAEKILAGSALPIDRAIENLMRLAGLTLAEAVRMATVDPARAVKMPGRQAGLAPGDRGDVVEFRFDPAGPWIEVLRTWLSGELVYERN